MKKKAISAWLKNKIHDRDKYTCQICGKKADKIIQGRAYEFNPLYEKEFLLKELEYQQKMKGHRKSIMDIDIYVSFDIDHIIPEVNGGPTIEDNLRLACRGCNRSRR